jgi:hypothetical protein
MNRVTELQHPKNKKEGLLTESLLLMDGCYRNGLKKLTLKHSGSILKNI